MRGPYKTKRLLKLESKEELFMQDEMNQRKMHKSTLKKVELAKQMLEEIRGNSAAVGTDDKQSAHESFGPVHGANLTGGATTEGATPKHCNCSNSGCLKLYCECFKNNRICGGACRC